VKLTIAQALAHDETREVSSHSMPRPMSEVVKGVQRCRGRGKQNGKVDAK
jgi:hypothetical protein